MIQQNNCATLTLPAAASTAAGTFACSWDTKGYDYAKVQLLLGTHSTSGTTVASVVISESDTVTSATSQTGIAALSSATATAATAANALPSVAVLGLGAVLEHGINLKHRKRYMGLYVTTGATTMTVGAIVTLSKSEVSKDTTTTKQVTDLASTATRGCAAFITA